jgi:REP element-mobilizing transposase RayT
MAKDAKGAATHENRRSIRLWYANYSAQGLCFVTICTFERRCTLGTVRGHRFLPSELGELARECWVAIPNHFARVKLDKFVVMPNHLHGILVLYPHVGAQHCCALSEGPDRKMLPGSLGAIVRSFKAIVARRAHKELGYRGPIWQRNYFERIVRDSDELAKTQQYISENPRRWELDADNPAAR